MKETKTADEKKGVGSENIAKWLKNSSNLILLLIIIFAVIIRVHYFSLTMNQALWWDESDYLAYAKNLAGLNSDWIATDPHFSIISWIIAAFFRLGLSEPTIKFVVEIIPSILLIPLTYSLINSMYKDKRVALISAFLMSTFWAVLFNSTRFHVDIPAMFFTTLTIYIFWKGYERKEKIFGMFSHDYAIPLAVIIFILAYSFRRGHFLVALFIIVYMLLTRKWKELIRDKKNWVGLTLGILLFILIEIVLFQGTVFEQGSGTNIFKIGETGLFAFISLGVFKAYFLNINLPIASFLLYLFWAGILLMVANLVLHLGYLRSTKEANLRPDLFFLLSIIFTLAFFILIFKPQGVFGEARWYFPLLLGCFVSISRATVFIADKIGGKKKYSILIIIILIGFGGYYQLQYADSLIKNKIPSFKGIQEAGLYLRELTNKDDVLISQPVPQTIYYSERKVIQPETVAGAKGPDYSLEQFLNGLNNQTNARYLLISFSEPNYPTWMRRYGQQNGQITSWEIPFMDTKIDFASGVQSIKQSKSYENITFVLTEVKQDVFIYRIDK
jgi:uncharacterized membrane protein